MAKQPHIYTVRGKKVVIDRELAALLGIPTGRLNEPYRRNIQLFSSDVAFQLTNEEFCSLKTQIAFSNQVSRGGSRHLPMVYTKEGISMLEKLLKRDIPIEFEEEIAETEILPESWNEGTVVLYQPNENLKIDVRVENETVWLMQEQMALLFGTKRQAISKHINNIYEVGELDKNQTCSILEQVQTEGGKQKNRYIKIYNLDMIISVGYRVNTRNGIAFRQWATKVLKQYLMHKGSLERRVIALEEQTKAIIVNTENRLCAVEQKVDFIVDTKLPPTEMVFYEGENFKAYDFLCTLIESAQNRIILIDNYIDRKTLMMLNKRAKGVSAIVFTNHKNLSDPQLQLDLIEANKKREAPLIQMLEIKHDHDRFLIIDNTTYLLGPSIKDAGVNRCAVVKMISTPEIILKNLIP